MANENQNTGPNPQQQSKKSILDAKEALRELIEDQGDYNNLLKSSIRDLDNMQKSYVRIAAKIDSLNKGTINVKQVQQELARLSQKEYTAKQKVLDLQEGLSQETKADLELQKSIEAQLKNQVTKKERYALLEKQKALDARLSSNIELKNLEYAKVGAKIAEEELNNGKSILETEKKVSKQMGISGNLAKILADKLGVGEEAYEAMSFQSRKLVKDNGDQVSTLGKWKVAATGLAATSKALVAKALDPAIFIAGAVGAYKLAKAGLDGIGNAAAKTGEFMAGLSEHSGNVVRGLTSGVSNLVKQIPFVGGLLGGLIDGFSALLDLILGVDNAIVKSGRQLNMSAESARGLYRALGQASRVSGDVYMTGIKYLESQVELTKELGITNQLSAEILRTNIQLKDFAGLEADTRAKITESSLITGRSAEATTKAVLSQVVGLRRATGVSFQYQQVLKEASSLSGYLGLQFAKYPEKLTKTLLSTKALGLELKSLDSKASGFLDFESSISKEFEAQLITGKEINLNKARQAFLDNDLATAASEIAKYTGSSAEFEKMKRIEQESFAAAMEMSRDELSDMLRQQELYTRFGVKNREDLLKQVDLLRQSGKAQEAINKAGGEAAYNDLVRASAQEKLALLLEKIKQSIVEFVEKSGLIEKVEKFINYLTNPSTIKGIIGTVRDAISNFIEFAGEMLADIVEVGGEIANFFTFGEKGDARERAAYQLGDEIRKGYMQISKNMKSGENYGTPVTVQDNVVKEKIASEKNKSKSNKDTASINNANMNGKESYVIQNHIILDDGVNRFNTRMNKGSFMDQQVGQSGIIVPSNDQFA